MMNVKVFIPRSDVLKEFIECYYFLNRTEKSENFQYLTFPSLNTVLSFMENTQVRDVNNHIKLSHNIKAPIISHLTIGSTKSIVIEYTCKVNEVTIYFKPLGLNVFLKDRKLPKNQELNNFIPYSDYLLSIKKILNESDINKRRSILESYWLNKFQEFKIPKLEMAIKMIHDDPSVHIQLVSEKVKLSNKSLIKIFKEYIGRTPSGYRKVLRFRNALGEKSNNLTQLSFEVKYFDQAHMIKEFKVYTGFTPKEFFSKLNHDSHKSIKWINI